jgi:hypothetical protein
MNGKNEPFCPILPFFKSLLEGFDHLLLQFLVVNFSIVSILSRVTGSDFTILLYNPSRINAMFL